VLVYSRQNPANPQQLIANDTLTWKLNFHPAKVTKVLVHGFGAGISFAHRFIKGKKVETKQNVLTF
jgi:hypothetical protein